MLTYDQILKEIKDNRIIIDPFNESQLGPNSYDVRLAPSIHRILDNQLNIKSPYTVEHNVIQPSGFMLMPGELYLGVTVERTVTHHHIPLYEGRSTTARYFISSHQTAGFGDIGFDGHWTLEITVQRPTIVYPMMKIGQIAFIEPTGQISKYYKGQYLNSTSPKAGIPGNF